jgi:hypothetical protein
MITNCHLGFSRVFVVLNRHYFVSDYYKDIELRMR